MATLKGFDTVMRNLNKEIIEIEGRTMKGLIKAQILIRRDMEHTAPLTPIDTGNLRASWFVVTSMKNSEPTEAEAPNFKSEKKVKDKDGKMRLVHIDVSQLKIDYETAVNKAQGKISSIRFPVLIMGFGANYAVFVHEMVDKSGVKINWSRPGSGPKFFESAINRNKDKVLQIIRDNAKIK